MCLLYFQVQSFTEEWGPVLPDDFDVDNGTPIDYFWLLWKPDTFATIARHTNNFARWSIEQKGEEDPRWTDEVDEFEMRAFIGINILMGVNSLPDAELYWNQNPLIGNKGIQNTMTCNRYQNVQQYFHVSDRETEPARGADNYDRLYKVRPIIDMVSDTFKSRYVLSREVAVDEAMVRYTGRLSFRQYMPAKPIKRGIKIWMMCDSNTSFLANFNVYLGKSEATSGNGLGYDVVSKLTEHIRNSNRHVYFDNFFTGIDLLDHLQANGLYGCGTVRANRKGFPPRLQKPKDLKARGDMKVLQRGESNLTATVWKDKKLVHHLSTLSDPSVVLDAQRRVGATVLHLRQPSTVSQYNKYMGAVDQHDQLRMKYDVGRNSKKWWRYIFWFLLNCSIVNAYILYKTASQRRTRKKRYTHIDFRLELINQLIGGYSRRTREATSNVAPGILVEQQNQSAHINTRMEGKRKRCQVHFKVHQKRRETVYGCAICNVHLCKDGCHNQFHNM